jgi:hypothetical protein
MTVCDEVKSIALFWKTVSFLSMSQEMLILSCDVITFVFTFMQGNQTSGWHTHRVSFYLHILPSVFLSGLQLLEIGAIFHWGPRNMFSSSYLASLVDIVPGRYSVDYTHTCCLYMVSLISVCLLPCERGNKMRFLN